MDEMDLAIDCVRRVIPLTPEEGDYFSSLLRIRRIRKKQAIAQPGFPCKHRSYIAKGAMRAYLVDDEQRLMETVPKFERFFRIITQRGYAFLQQRLLSNLSKIRSDKRKKVDLS
ncbi:MAG TPA: hypothetical protein VHE34_04335 [Puia sp.]|uniref:hypothetical protein n=1 Tax=Puia sp. TaxID=2045100 RepID=UPI002B8A8B9F|nr:hypothetical protein [Puia sp.]HVU94424.1 hypothetical protein [Puia sp.]